MEEQQHNDYFVIIGAYEESFFMKQCYIDLLCKGLLVDAVIGQVYARFYLN